MSEEKFSKKVYHTTTTNGRAIDVWFKEGSKSGYAQALVAAKFLSICFERINGDWQLYVNNEKTFVHFDILHTLEPLYQLYINDIITGD